MPNIFACLVPFKRRRRNERTDSSFTETAFWACDDCSFINVDQVLACGMCLQVRVSAKDMDYQWEWAPHPEQWIPYDIPTAAHLEQHYQAKATTAKLSKGPYFSLCPRQYSFLFDYANRKFYQVNNQSGTLRPARRRDKNDGIQVVTRNVLTEEDRCVICQERFDEQDLADIPVGKEVVKLTVCFGHYFHRDCISCYVRLRGACPVCFRKVNF
ncbi:hypothetical protein HDU85_002510 [Gaertneriomyces sp. JEL0708]|nr:hypothetical protein HDU85_002510 [Gaertneriomyces sp. JEL0708]